MATGLIAWTCLLLAAGTPDDVVYMNHRGFQIPIRIQPERKNEVRELILYLSRDKGRTWEISNRSRPPEGVRFHLGGRRHAVFQHRRYR